MSLSPRVGGYTLYIKDGRVTYETNSYGHLSGSLVSPETLTPGKAKVIVEVTPAGSDGSGQPGVRWSFPMITRLIVNGKMAGDLELMPAPSGDIQDIGSDLVPSVSPEYGFPFAFTGKIDSVMIDLL